MNGIPQYPPTVWALVEEAATRWADHVLLADDHGRSLTGRQLHDRGAAVAADLATRGIGAGTVVSWQLPTTLESIVVKVALARLGAVQNPLVPILREREVGFVTEPGRHRGDASPPSGGAGSTTARWHAISPPSRGSR